MAIEIRGSAPLLQVFDMPTSIAFYRDVLGFKVISTSTPGDRFDWALLRLDGVELMLNTAYEDHERPPAPDPARIASHADTAIFFGCPDVDAAYSHLRAQGLDVDKPVVQAYGMKQLWMTDPDGYKLCFQWSAVGHWILDPLFREAVSAIDAGDVSALNRLLAANPRLVRDRIDCYENNGEKDGEEYFRQPYLLWFIAENPIRNGKLPGNIAQVTQAILRAMDRERVDSLREQIDYALALVCSGKVARECGVQRELIDVLADAGADPNGALVPALAHREIEAVERLLERGAGLTLLAAACTGRADDFTRLAREASAGDRQTALAGAALYGRADALAALIDLGVDLNAYNPLGFHAHGTALHHAVDSGSLEAVKVLVEAGADLGTEDRLFHATPLGWADYLQRTEIAAYLRERG
jgi:catechol 2,3-dioxygenase-like lactoylglutathione lyase family enzyme